MKRIAIYPGSFDPVTNGHVDIVDRARRMFDHVIVGVSQNRSKAVFFSAQDRVDMLRVALKGRSHVSVEHFSDLLASFARRKKASAVVRGLRAVSDFEYEFQMALMNRRLNRRFETVFLMPDEKYTYLSSSLVRQVSMLGGSLRGLVPSVVETALRKRSLTTP